MRISSRLACESVGMDKLDVRTEYRGERLENGNGRLIKDKGDRRDKRRKIFPYEETKPLTHICDRHASTAGGIRTVLCLHFDRGDLEISSRMGREYERR